MKSREEILGDSIGTPYIEMEPYLVERIKDAMKKYAFQVIDHIAGNLRDYVSCYGECDVHDHLVEDLKEELR